jgi:hypothetical protein
MQYNFIKKNKESEKRHEKNAIRVKKESLQLEKETEEREFKKYITYYFSRKSQSQSFLHRKKNEDNKNSQKAEKLGEIEKKNEENRKKLINKMKKMDKLRENFKKIKEQKYEEDKIKRDERKKNLRDRLIEIDKEEGERRKDILDYQSEILLRSLNKTNINMRKSNSGINIIKNQIALQNHMNAFYKKLNNLKSQSVFRKSQEERIKMYKELKRKEAERIKKEKEDELYNNS